MAFDCVVSFMVLGFIKIAQKYIFYFLSIFGFEPFLGLLNHGWVELV